MYQNISAKVRGVHKTVRSAALAKAANVSMSGSIAHNLQHVLFSQAKEEDHEQYTLVYGNSGSGCCFVRV